VPPRRRNSSFEVPSIASWPPRRLLRLLVASALGVYGWRRFGSADYWDLLDDVNLAIHEAGHVVFAPLGDHPGVIGGSLFQVLVPAAFVAYFLVRHDRFAASVVMAWVGASLGNVARYIADARVQDLPLLGGENVIHDWWYLLIEWDLLSRDLIIAQWVRMAGALAFVVAVTGGVLFSRSEVESHASNPVRGNA
jgi:hypothetical protein